ncbi:hypothetical protein IT407_02025 [Candidatus Uhrbacteria bacterium]|nr:hypothetical protein [Candidatus Uhrbacteria bacterium]
MAQPDFPPGSVVRAFKDGEVHYVGEFISCDGQLMTLRTMGPLGAPWLDSFSIKGYAFECWEDLKGVEGVAFARLMDKDDDWCEHSFFEKFAQRELEILFLEGDVRVRDDAAKHIPAERLVELILKQDNYEAAYAALLCVTDEQHLRHLAGQTEDCWELDDDEAEALRVVAMKRYKDLEQARTPQDKFEPGPEPEPLKFPTPSLRNKGELPPTYVEKQERLKAAEKARKKAVREKNDSKPWWKLW